MSVRRGVGALAIVLVVVLGGLTPPATAQTTGDWEPPPGAVPEGASLYLESPDGEYVGQGDTLLYTPAEATFTLRVEEGRLLARVSGGDVWDLLVVPAHEHGGFALGAFPAVRTGTDRDTRTGILSFTGAGRGCNRSEGWVAIDAFEGPSHAPTAVTLRFAQRCDGGPALHGRLAWDSEPQTPPPDNPQAPPAGLWEPPAALEDVATSYLWIDGEDTYVGQDREWLITPFPGANFPAPTVEAATGTVDVDARGHDAALGGVHLNLTIAGPAPAGVPAPGFYDQVTRHPFHNATVGGLSLSGEARGCNTLTGWFLLEEIAVDPATGTATALTLRFEQRCSGDDRALRGVLHYRADGGAPPPDPDDDEQDRSWTPPPGAVPADGSSLYVESAPGDWVGQGRTYRYTLLDAAFEARGGDGWLELRLHGDERWTLFVRPPRVQDGFVMGSFPAVSVTDVHGPHTGEVAFGGEGRSCGGHTGWVAIDEVRGPATAPTGLTLRFEQRCDGDPPLRGQLVWDADAQAPPPPNPQEPPADLWEPPAHLDDLEGTYLWFEGEDDWIARGREWLVTPVEDPSGGPVLDGHTLRTHFKGVAQDGEEAWWSLRLRAPEALGTVVPGFYADVQRDAFSNPRRGGFDLSGDGRGCNESLGWFSVDELVVDPADGSVDVATVRFEFRCDSPPGPTRGVFRYVAEGVVPPEPEPERPTRIDRERFRDARGDLDRGRPDPRRRSLSASAADTTRRPLERGE